MWNPRTYRAFGLDTVDAVDSVVVKPLLRGWSHVLAFTVIGVLGIIMASVAGASFSERLWLIVYVAGTLTMFGVSAMYHTLPWGDSWSLDHAPSRPLGDLPGDRRRLHADHGGGGRRVAEAGRPVCWRGVAPSSA